MGAPLYGGQRCILLSMVVPSWKLQRLQPALGLVSESVISHVLHLCPLKGPTNVRTINHILERIENTPWKDGSRKLEGGSVKAQIDLL